VANHSNEFTCNATLAWSKDTVSWHFIASGKPKEQLRRATRSPGPIARSRAHRVDQAANEFGWYFPSTKDPSKPVSHGTLYSFVWRQRDRGVAALLLIIFR